MTNAASTLIARARLNRLNALRRSARQTAPTDLVRQTAPSDLARYVAALIAAPEPALADVANHNIAPTHGPSMARLPVAVSRAV